MRVPIIAAMLALAGCAASSEMQASQRAEARNDLATALGDRVPGAPRDCISISDSDGPQIIDDRTILYKPVGRTLWRNDLGSSCPGLRPYTTLIVEVHGSQLCRNDRFRVLDPGSSIPGAYCMFGRFTPYEKAK
ncbi:MULTISPECIES: DUF6491 family protein [Sphingomonas]|uniref:Lipoprotein n=1 Tax=Sphingomonas leidyi TaxID=68569 RepID=A0A7X5V400_9SPHN|nr:MULTISPECIES: DUF6491 family protein [Sphingomonas]MBN8812755.1 hypothetical protein [Sphingomonas sp.]NIJ67446.1 hypothetical protein [Sphingomonas leidyi]